MGLFRVELSLHWPRYPASASLSQSFSQAAFSLTFRPVQCLSGLALQNEPQCPTVLP